MEHVLEELSSKEVREHMADILNRVAYNHKRYALTRHGNPVAVLMAFDEWQAIEKILQRLEDEEDVRDADAAMERIKKEGGIPLEKVKRELGL